jgi:hypothetical protein
MQAFPFKKTGLAIVSAISITIGALLIWQHFHGGVPSHSFMAREDMPAISNWWGALLLPLLTYFTLFRLQKRLSLLSENSVVYAMQVRSALFLFGAGLLYAGAMAYCFVTDQSDINGILFQGLFLLALIFPLYRAEFFLGFVLGLTYTFGAILPTLIGAVIGGISFIVHRFVYPFVSGLFKRK